MKSSLIANQCLFVLDFAENYAFVEQDAVQGQHWNNNQCTLHLTVIYYVEDGETKCASFCFVSDDLRHDAAAVNSYLQELFNEIKVLIPNLEKVIAWSDGGPNHYKNRFNFANISTFLSDFRFVIEWHFFATCHGKNAGDGIGGTTKRLIRRAALQGVTINSPRLLFEWANISIQNIKFIYVDSATIDLNRKRLVNLPSPKQLGTHKLHSFIPVSNGILNVSRISNIQSRIPSKIVTVKPPPALNQISAFDLFVDDFIACVFDNYWAIGQVLDVQGEEGVNVKLMKPYGKSLFYTWPMEVEEIVFPIEHQF